MIDIGTDNANLYRKNHNLYTLLKEKKPTFITDMFAKLICIQCK